MGWSQRAMRARVKKTNKIIQIRPSTVEPRKWLDLDGNSYDWDDLEPIRVEAGTQTGVIKPITLTVNTKSSGEIS